VYVGEEFQVNSYTPSDQLIGEVAAAGDGDFVVVWEGAVAGGSATEVLGQRFSSAGLKLGTEFQVNTFTVNFQNLADVALDASGEFLVAWQSSTAPADLLARRFDSAGQPKGTDFVVNSGTSNVQNGPKVAAVGSFVVTWQMRRLARPPA
jgi:hypothetical protein